MLRNTESKIMALATSFASMLAVAAFSWAWKQNTNIVLLQDHVSKLQQNTNEDRFKKIEDELDKRFTRFWIMKRWTVDEINKIETKVFGFPPPAPNLSD